MNARMQRAKQMMETKGYCSQINSTEFSVRSQSNPEKRYFVRRTGNGLVRVNVVLKACTHIVVALNNATEPVLPTFK